GARRDLPSFPTRRSSDLEAEKPLVLERFKRGAASGARAGSGLGLSIVRRVAEAHNGALRLEDREGGGLVVEIDLPLVGRNPKLEDRKSTRLNSSHVKISY